MNACVDVSTIDRNPKKRHALHCSIGTLQVAASGKVIVFNDIVDQLWLNSSHLDNIHYPHICLLLSICHRRKKYVDKVKK